MKKKLLILCVCLLAIAILCFPMKTQFREGGTTFYSALAYRVIVWHVLSSDENGPRTGRDIYLFPNNFRDYEYYYEWRFGAKFDENATAAPATTEVPTELQPPTETPAPASTKAPTPAGPALPVYVPGSIKLDEGSVSEFLFRATKRYAYYHIPGLLSGLVPEGAIAELLKIQVKNRRKWC